MCSMVHKDPTKFCYFETHAGDGTAEFATGKIENGSAAIAVQQAEKIAEKRGKPFRCIFMEIEKENYKKLTRLFPQKKYPYVFIYWGDSNEEIGKILDRIPEYYHSLGFIDPYAPDDLKWDTIKIIAKHEYLFSGGDIRRPELLITFPIKRIKQNAGFLEKEVFDAQAQLYCKFNDKFFGTQDWRNVWVKYKDSSVESREELRNLYIRRLSEYYKYCLPIVLVEELEKHVPLYYMISCTNHWLGDKFLRELSDRIEKWKKEDLIRDYYGISMPIEAYTKGKK